MPRPGLFGVRGCIVLTVFAVLTRLDGPAAYSADSITLKNGVQLEGKVGKIASLVETPLDKVGSSGEITVQSIVFVDDDMRRVFFPSRQVQSTGQAIGARPEKIKIDQRVPTSGKRIGAAGPIISISNWDEYGRRTLSMQSAQGTLNIVQGITEITPTYTRVEGLQTKSPYIWDMRIATSSVPAETISNVVRRQIDLKNADDRLRIVRLYIQSERLADARVELEGVLRDFPELAELEKQVTALNQFSAQRLIKEIELRRDAGQHQLAHDMLKNYPTKGIAGETLLKVRDMLDGYQKQFDESQQALTLFGMYRDKLDMKVKEPVEAIEKEMTAELSIHNLDRLADFVRLADDDKLTPDQKVSLAISAWILGSGSGTENLSVSLSLVEVRELVRRYLLSTRHAERQQILEDLQAHEGSTPGYIAKIVAQMKPPGELPTDAGIPGLLKLSVAGLAGEPETTYYAQLPAEYNPYRRYPCVVTLCGAGSTPIQQVDWWAGSPRDKVKTRLGPAARQGYVVIAPEWTKDHQRRYEYSAREHAAVLNSLRDACRRLSIDTDRVFLSGHSMGGDAVWDIALAHPDLWAGVIPIAAQAEKYISRYTENGRMVPFYFVGGQMDGNKMALNGKDLDRYLTRAGYDVMIVDYLGRGHEHFQDEIQRIFQWMKLHQRNFFQREFKVVSMRPWDNYFWWLEMEDFPSQMMVVPAAWPPASGTRPIENKGEVQQNNRVTAQTAARKTTVWLSPDMVDFQQKIVVTINSRAYNNAQASTEVLLEDVRTRGDRLHPFWAKVESVQGRVK